MTLLCPKVGPRGLVVVVAVLVLLEVLLLLFELEVPTVTTIVPQELELRASQTVMVAVSPDVAVVVKIIPEPLMLSCTADGLVLLEA